MSEQQQAVTQFKEDVRQYVSVYHDITAKAKEVSELRKLIQASPGRCPVHLHIRKAGQAWTSLKLGDAFRTVPDEPLMQGLETLFRRPDVPRLS